MNRQLFRLLIILAILLSACGMPVSVVPSEPSPHAIAQVFATRDPNAPPTPTPFQPQGPTATAKAGTSIETPLPGITPTPTDKWGGIAGTPPTRITEPMPEGMVNLMLLGSDYRPESGYRTDVIMLVSINTKKSTVSVTSFPRDLYVTIPGWEVQRINTAQPHGGFEMFADTMEYNFGVRPTYYVMTNFQGFIGIIDSLGGVDINASQGLEDTCDLPWGSAGWCSIGAGANHMDGRTALWYVRARHSTSDFDRTRRAQEVIQGVFARLMRLDAVTRLPELYDNYLSSVETNMKLQDMLPLLPIASQVMNDTSRISRYAVGPQQVTPWVTEGGGSVLLPNYDAIKALLEQAIFGE